MSKDAWEQHHDLVERYTKEWEPRPDLRVDAYGLDRSVRVSVGNLRDSQSPLSKLGRYDWHSSGQRNVSTMRELAESILAACDFVEGCNPQWAARGDRWRDRVQKLDTP